MALTIGALARSTGCTVQTIRCYEQLGLVPAPLRSQGNQRRYAEAHASRLAFIRHARELGFSLSAIRALLQLSDNSQHSCSAVDEIATVHLRDVESKIARLESLRHELKRMIHSCRGGQIADCRVIEVLADHTHSRCLTGNHAAKGDDVSDTLASPAGRARRHLPGKQS